jgi:hypothetical protein
MERADSESEDEDDNIETQMQHVPPSDTSPTDQLPSDKDSSDEEETDSSKAEDVSEVAEKVPSLSVQFT